ncbi:hypothetical protein E4U27_001541 [Claviceps purpurea]|nr:hypothetical protein E4U27_001541 [Claviceps purpurea]
MSVIGQYVAFTVMILKASHEPGQEERLRILNSLPRWNRPSAGYVPEDENSFSGSSSPEVEGASGGSSPPEDGQVFKASETQRQINCAEEKITALWIDHTAHRDAF